MYYENYKKLRDEKGVRDADVAKATGIDPATFSHWSKDLYTPKDNKLTKIADYFGITLEKLKDKKQNAAVSEPNGIFTKIFSLFGLKK